MGLSSSAGRPRPAVSSIGAIASDRRHRIILLAIALAAAVGIVAGAALAGPAPSASAAVMVAAKKGGGGGGNGGGNGGGGSGGGSTERPYVAVGDSYAAGVGANSYLDTTCYRSSKSYPSLLDADAAANLTLTSFTACSGASTADVIGGQLSGITSTTQIVTLTVGGNDLGFSDIMQSCFVIIINSTCDTRLTNAETLVANGTIQARIEDVVGAIRARSASATIIVTGYPRLFDPDQTKYAWGDRVNTDTTALNGAIAAAASATGARFVDVEPAFAGHGIGSSSSWINDFRWLSTTNSFHPTATGYVAYEAAVAAQLP